MNDNWAEMRAMFLDDETFYDFIDWQYDIKKRNWAAKPDCYMPKGMEEWRGWIIQYFTEHPDKTPAYATSE